MDILDVEHSMVEEVCRNYVFIVMVFFFQAEDGIRDLVRSRGLGDVYKRQVLCRQVLLSSGDQFMHIQGAVGVAQITQEATVADLSLIHI